MKILVLSQSDVRNAVTMTDAIEAVAAAFTQLSRGQAIVPVRAQVPIAKRDANSFFMPAYLASTDRLGMKFVSVFPHNSARELPTISALVVMVDSETGQPAAILDGGYLTALRTGAASGAATRVLSRRDSKTLAVFGAGAQGRTQLEAVCAVRDISSVEVFDPRSNIAESFVSEVSAEAVMRGVRLRAAASASEAVSHADVICTATTATTPVFPDAKLKAGVHINAIGSFTPEMQELPSETIARARVVVDSREACWAETGDLLTPHEAGLITREHIESELGELDTQSLARREEDGVTVFKSVGVAVQDVAVGSLVVDRAREKGLGTVVDL